jgi:hypothetical protein
MRPSSKALLLQYEATRAHHSDRVGSRIRSALRGDDGDFNRQINFPNFAVV